MADGKMRGRFTEYCRGGKSPSIYKQFVIERIDCRSTILALRIDGVAAAPGQNGCRPPYLPPASGCDDPDFWLEVYSES